MRKRFPLLMCVAVVVALVTIGVVSGASGASSPAARSFAVTPDVSNPSINFCPNSVGTIDEVSTDNAAGVTWASSIDVPLSGGNVGVYFKNNGPGPITFADPSSWSVKGTTIPRAASTSIALTPKGSTATFNDLYWSGTFGEDVEILGCTDLSNVSVKTDQQGTAHLDLSFYRGATLYKVRVNDTPIDQNSAQLMLDT